jgi:hypothetical protein
MITATREERYTQAVTREMESDNLRRPVWDQALATANGDETAARNYYLKLRVVQMVEQEVEFETKFLARKNAQRKADEQQVIRQWEHSGLAIGVVLLLIIALLLRYGLELFIQRGFP